MQKEDNFIQNIKCLLFRIYQSVVKNESEKNQYDYVNNYTRE